MLTRDQFSRGFELIDTLSKWNILPIEIITQTGEILLQRSLRRRVTSYVLYSITVLHTIYMWVRLIQSIIEEDKLILHHFLLHLLVASAFAMVMAWYAAYFIIWPEITVNVFNSLFPKRKLFPSLEAHVVKVRG